MLLTEHACTSAGHARRTVLVWKGHDVRLPIAEHSSCQAYSHPEDPVIWYCASVLLQATRVASPRRPSDLRPAGRRSGRRSLDAVTTGRNDV